MAQNPHPSILCFGEILWDFLPAGLFAGGAPFNVAYHLHQLGSEARLVSAIGRDLLGDELLRRLGHWKMDTGLVARHQGLPTGYVRAELSASGDASYDIVTSVAWDQITVDAEVVRHAVTCDAIVFGTLAQRSTFNRAALDRLLAVLPEHALRVFDVNLRPPHDDVGLARELAARSTLLKLNSAEAARLAGGADTPGAEQHHARQLASRTGCPAICITCAERGAGLLRHDTWHWEPGRPVDIADTIGAGDSFLASLVTHLLQGRLSDGESLARACRLGEWVASQSGATPAYPPSSS